MNTLLTKLCSHLDLKPEHTALLNKRDTSDVWRQFAIWLLVDEDLGVIRFTTFGSKQYNAINRVAQLYIEDCKDVKRWKEASAAATNAGDTAACCVAAACSADTAAWCAAAWCADIAVWCATAATAHSAAIAAAYTARATYGDATAAGWAHYKCCVDKLIELLHAAPMITTNKQFQS